MNFHWDVKLLRRVILSVNVIRIPKEGGFNKIASTGNEINTNISIGNSLGNTVIPTHLLDK